MFPHGGAQLHARLERGSGVQDKRDSWSGWEQVLEQGSADDEEAGCVSTEEVVSPLPSSVVSSGVGSTSKASSSSAVSVSMGSTSIFFHSSSNCAMGIF